MAALILRTLSRAGDTTKGSPLTNAEIDQNFINLDASIDLRAPLASPALTGTPTTPTPAAGLINTQIANTTFVNSEINRHILNQSIVPNGSFEEPLAGSWPHVLTLGGTFDRVQSDAISGAWSLRAHNTTMPLAGWMLRSTPRIPVTGEAVYRLTGSVRTSPANVHRRITTEWYDAAGAHIGGGFVIAVDAVSSDTVYHTFSGIGTAPINARTVEVSCHAMHHSNGVPGTVWFDAIELVREHVTPISLGGTGRTDGQIHGTVVHANIGATDHSALIASGTSARGAELALHGTGTAPSKFIRSAGNNLHVVNSAQTQNILTLTDGGALSVADPAGTRTNLDVPSRTGAGASGTWPINIAALLGSAAAPSISFGAGTGIFSQDPWHVNFATGGVSRGHFSASGLFVAAQGGSEGGEIILAQAPVGGTHDAVRIDVLGRTLRFFTIVNTGETARVFNLPLNSIPEGTGTNLLTEHGLTMFRNGVGGTEGGSILFAPAPTNGTPTHISLRAHQREFRWWYILNTGEIGREITLDLNQGAPGAVTPITTRAQLGAHLAHDAAGHRAAIGMTATGSAVATAADAAGARTAIGAPGLNASNFFTNSNVFLHDVQAHIFATPTTDNIANTVGASRHRLHLGVGIPDSFGWLALQAIHHRFAAGTSHFGVESILRRQSSTGEIGPEIGFRAAELRVLVGHTLVTEISGIGNRDLRHNGFIIPFTDNAFQIGWGGGRWSSVWAVNGVIQTSDGTDKTDIESVAQSKAVDFLGRLDPVTYRWRTGGRKVEHVDDGEDEVEVTNEDGTKRIERRPRKKEVVTDTPGKRRHCGFTAQNVRQALTEAGLDTPEGDALGVWVSADPTDPNAKQFMRPDQLIPLLVAGWQAQQQRIVELEGRIVALEAKNRRPTPTEEELIAELPAAPTNP